MGRGKQQHANVIAGPIERVPSWAWEPTKNGGKWLPLNLGGGTRVFRTGDISPADAEHLADFPWFALSAVRPFEIFRLAGRAAAELRDDVVDRRGRPHRDLRQSVDRPRAVDA